MVLEEGYLVPIQAEGRSGWSSQSYAPAGLSGPRIEGLQAEGSGYPERSIPRFKHSLNKIGCDARNIILSMLIAV